jgi:hypothetical protein
MLTTAKSQGGDYRRFVAVKAWGVAYPQPFVVREYKEFGAE